MAAYLAEQPDVIVAYHFGSTAAGTARPDSDLDIAILLDEDADGPSRLSRQIDLYLNLDEMDAREVQVTILNDVSLLFAYNVIAEGKCFYERSPGERVEFQVGALKRYFDFQPILDFQNKAFIERVKERGLAGD